MEIRAENVEKLNVGEHPGARLCKGLLLDAIEAGDKLEARVKELETENERLKVELEMEHDDCINAKKCEIEYHKAYEKELDENVTLRKENAKLKCLALLYKREMYFAKADKEYMMFCDSQTPLFEINNHHYEDADNEYRKAKKELMEHK